MTPDNENVCLYASVYLAIVLCLFVAKLYLRDKRKGKENAIVHYYCKSCDELNLVKDKKCVNCGHKSQPSGPDFCSYCGKHPKTRPYISFLEFWVTLGVLTLFLPFLPFYFIQNFHRKICRNCKVVLPREKGFSWI